jgi:uncharacterized protein YrzB (UPF0473 family)
MHEQARDHIIVKDNQGNEKEYAVAALFDMRDDFYALLKSGDEMIVMKIEEENGRQFLAGRTDPIENEAILDTYQIMVQNVK